MSHTGTVDENIRGKFHENFFDGAGVANIRG